jgi:hypothetical protein
MKPSGRTSKRSVVRDARAREPGAAFIHKAFRSDQKDADRDRQAKGTCGTNPSLTFRAREQREFARLGK